jgi:signal transduction histidine kinase/CheY-like chemotaxis protein
MWDGLRISSKGDPNFISAVRELSQSTLRTLIFATGGICFAWYVTTNVTSWHVTVTSVSYVLLVVAVTSFVAVRLMPRHLLAAQAIWLIGLVVAIFLAIYLFQRPEIAFLYMLLPLISSVTMNWPAGLATEGAIAGLVWWLSHSQGMPPLPPAYSPVIIAGGALSGMLGWAATHALLTVTEWSLFSFEQARREMEDAREQRMEFKQVQQDLIQANQELARLSDRLKAAHRVAQEARQAKEEFVANVSHELRTPLNMIIGFSEMIMQLPQVYGGRLPQALLADIAAIQRNSQHLAKLVDDVLDLSQVDAGRMALSKEWTSLQEITDEACQAVGALFASKGLYLKTEVPTGLPLVLCDRTRIRQVVINLLSNAGRFTEHGGVWAKVRRQEEDVVISVADTGPGIALEDQQRLFEPFQQLDSSIRRRHGGSGLGLSISKRFVEMHGGKIWLESRVGVGTTIFFSLPLEMPSTDALHEADAVRRWFSPYDGYEYKLRTRRSKAPAPTAVPRFVLVEKGKTLQRLFSHYLPDFEMASFQDVEEAVQALNRSPAQALIVNAPLFEEITKRLGDLPYCTPAVTCWVPGEDESARQLGVVRYLVKPISRKMLLSPLEELGQDVQSVLLVDDDPEVLRLFARMLSSSERSYRLMQATSGERALDLMRERQPDVVLLDLIMPGMDGFQILQAKSQDPAIQEIPVIVVSSRDPSGDLIASDTLTVTCSGGLSVRNLLACIRAVSEILSPTEAPAQAPSVRPGD